MKNSSDLELFIQELETHECPRAYLQEKLLSLGGKWQDSDAPVLYEIHFLGIGASGMGADAATRNWIAAAKERILLDSGLQGSYSQINGSVAQLVRAERS